MISTSLQNSRLLFLTVCLIFLLDYPVGFQTYFHNQTSNIPILLKLAPLAAWPVFVESNAIFSVSQTGNLRLTLDSLTSYLSLKFHIQSTSKTYRLHFQNFQNPSISPPPLLALWSKPPSFLFWIIAIASKLISSWVSIPRTATRVILPLYHSSSHNPLLASLLIVWKQKSTQKGRGRPSMIWPRLSVWPHFPKHLTYSPLGHPCIFCLFRHTQYAFASGPLHVMVPLSFTFWYFAWFRL